MKKKILIILGITMLCLCSCEKIQTAEPVATEKAEKPDIDLTTLSSTMVYSEVSNIMQDPEAYKGKTIKIRGAYAPIKTDDPNVFYPACLIQDATACCQQGIEFVTKNGEYPAEGRMIVVQGKYESYVDKQDGVTYYHLNNAVLL